MSFQESLRPSDEDEAFYLHCRAAYLAVFGSSLTNISSKHQLCRGKLTSPLILSKLLFHDCFHCCMKEITFACCFRVDITIIFTWLADQSFKPHVFCVVLSFTLRISFPHWSAHGLIIPTQYVKNKQLHRSFKGHLLLGIVRLCWPYDNVLFFVLSSSPAGWQKSIFCDVK